MFVLLCIFLLVLLVMQGTEDSALLNVDGVFLYADYKTNEVIRSALPSTPLSDENLNDHFKFSFANLNASFLIYS